MRRYASALSAGLLAWNNVVHLLPGASSAYVPLNLAATGAVLASARRRGLSWTDLGLDPDRLGSGARWGGAAAAAVAGAFVAAAIVPGLHPLLDDARVRGLDLRGVVYHALVRVPLGTVLLEEIAFRGALFGALVRMARPSRAALVSSAVFGLWHVRPTLSLLNANDVASGTIARTATVGAAVAFTAAGGVFFCMLRLRSGSTTAPILAHIATNSFGVVASTAAR